MDLTAIPEFIAVPVSVISFFFFGSALIRGTYRHLADMFGFHGKVRNYLVQGKPLNKNENALTVLIANMSVEPENWNFFTPEGSSRYSQLSITNGKVIVYNCMAKEYGYEEFWGYYGPTLEIEGVGKYKLSDVRPCLIAEFARTVENLRSNRASNALISQLT